MLSTVAPEPESVAVGSGNFRPDRVVWRGRFPCPTRAFGRRHPVMFSLKTGLIVPKLANFRQVVFHAPAILENRNA